MKSYITLAILAAGAIAIYMTGPSVLMGGPSYSEIERVSREAMRSSAPTTSIAATASNADVTPKGFCNKAGDTFACIVEVVAEGQPPKTFVTELRKDENGNWVAAQ
ncbi:hypothetical protein RA27_22535 [Ruegeria sp. ANG-R]|uniref:hypothetical protein n=1 Tax=Ruegeria sp. ANG-R TaxID=1577903 RepID=UPI0005808EC9|nr:hypothetical protein [Ruegeria sp. ANG-R]KIC35911.1 hypothetical protein RA27_22535 [Ruegeria sp. ANG-R]